MASLHVLRVFADALGEHGNPLGVFVDGGEVPGDLRQAVAADLGFSETVFVDDVAHGTIEIYTPGVELPFAGHPCVGTAWLLRREAAPELAVLDTMAGEVRIHADGELTWIAARPEWSPPFENVELGSPVEVDSLSGAPDGLGLAYCWAWADEGRGLVRARAFVAEAGIAEDEATGSAAIALAAQLDRPIEVQQGRGSELLARPLGDGLVEVGGRVVLDDVREYEV